MSFTISNAQAPSSNTVPSATNRTQTVNYTEDTTAAIADIVVTDPDAADTFTATITMASGDNSIGSLSAYSGNGETFTSGTGVWTFTTTNITALNNALAAMSFIPASNLSTNTTAFVSVSDGVAAALTGTITFNGTAVNDVPVLGGTFTTAGTVFDFATTTPFSGVTVTDVEASNVSIDITYTATNGTLTGTGLSGSAGNYTLSSAAPATTQSRLQALVFTPTTNQVAVGSTVVTTFTLTPNDGTDDGAANATTQITASPWEPFITAVYAPGYTYTAGNNLDFIVFTNENVTVNTGGGIPRFTLTIGATTKYASYISGTGTSALIFRYTVESGLSDTNGIAVGSTIDLNGGTIKDLGGSNLDTGLSGGSFSYVLVDSIAPTVTGSATTGSPAANATSVIFRMTFSESVNNIDLTDFELTGTYALGTPSWVSAASGSTVDISVVLPPGDQGSVRLDLNAAHNLADSAGNAISGGYTGGTPHTVDLLAPMISAISIPNSAMKVGSVATATVTVTNDTDDYTTGSGGITGTINGFTLGGLSKINSSTYTAQFTVTEGGTDVVAGSDIPVNFTLTDSIGNTSPSYTTAIVQTADSIDANSPTVTGVTIPNSAMKVGDTVTVSITASEANLSLVSGTINSVAVTGFTDGGGGSYSATYNVAEGDTYRASGDSIPVSLMLEDSSGNNSNTYTTAIVQAADSIDASSPTISTNTGLTLNEGATGAIGTSELSSTDTDSDDASLAYTVTGASTNGQLENSDNSGVAISSFSQLNINDGKISYVHDGSNTTSDSFTFKVSDGSNELTGQTFSLTVTAVDDDTPTISANTGWIVNEGATGTITTTELSATDTDTDDTTLTYTVTSGVSNGQLENSDNVGVAISSFSQLNINDGKISYVHDGSNTTSDSFTFTVSDGSNDLTGQTFSITVNSVNDVPINSAPPTVSGVTTVGNILSCTTGTWDDADGDTVTYSYQWQADGINIGTDSANYTLTASEAGKLVTCEVTADDGQGGIVSVTSASQAIEADSDGDGTGDSSDAFPDDASLVAAYLFDGGSPIDSSGYGNDGVISGGVTAATDRCGSPGNSGYFDGSGWVDVTHSASLAIGTNLSVIGWVRGTEIPDQGFIIGKKTNLESTGDSTGWLLESSDLTGPFVSIGTEGDPGVNLQHDSGVTVEDGDWHQIAFTWDDPNDEVRMFVDGINVYTATETAVMEPNTADLVLGWLNYNLYPEDRYQGALDDLRIYNRTLTPLEMESLYTTESGCIVDICPGFDDDLDGDGDGVPDGCDAFPIDPAASVDGDGDGDPDSWNPGMYSPDSTTGLVMDDDDDNDGVPDEFDMCVGFDDNIDSDFDGIPDGCDDFMTDPAASVDSDDDGLPDDWNPGMGDSDSTTGLTVVDADDDNDGIPDADDAFPLDPTPIPDGISVPPTVTDNSGFKRLDNGDKYSNKDIDNGEPRCDIGYLFEIVIKDALASPATTVRLVVNGNAQEMALESGNLVDGALYSLTLKLGPANTHNFYYEALDALDNVVYLYPPSGQLPGPVVELLNGPSMVGLGKDMSASPLDLVQLLNSNAIYEWVSTGLTTDVTYGSYVALGNTDYHTPGQGYFVVRESASTLMDISAEAETAGPSISHDLLPGWNIISNPYGGHISLIDIQVQRDAESAVTWAEASTNRWVNNAIYWYLGSDWGGSYTFESAGGIQEATLVPWTAYWIYVIRDDATYSLIFTKP